jgi:hypothetical protein
MKNTTKHSKNTSTKAKPSKLKKKKKKSAERAFKEIEKKRKRIDDDDLDLEDENEDNETDEEEADIASARAELSRIDPGPSVEDVPCGFNCASCAKFVRLDSSKRTDPEWLTMMINKKASSRCPYVFPEEIVPAEGKSLKDYVVRADSTACDKFEFMESRLENEAEKSALRVIRGCSPDLVSVFAFEIGRIKVLKTDEDKYGYRLGETVRLNYTTKDERQLLLKCEVVDFQRKKGAEVIVRPINPQKGVPAKLAIAARRLVAVE